MNIDLTSLIEVFPRGLLSLLTLFFITKMIGKKQVSEMSLFDYVMGISIGNFAAEITINTDVPLINGIVAVVIFGVVAFIISKLTMKNLAIRKFVTGTPTIIMQDGKFIPKNMAKISFDLNDFLEQGRENGYFDVSEIDCAVVEADGKISFLPKAQYKPLTPKDMQKKSSNQGLSANIILDGLLLEENLNAMGKDAEWLKKELKVRGHQDYQTIFLATLNKNGKLEVYVRDDTLKGPDILE